MKVLVVGAAGYAGGELLRLLDRHPHVTGWTATSRSQAGKPVAGVHPALLGTTATFSADDPVALAAAHDVVFLALEHGESSRLAGALLAAGPRLVVDIAADFRVQDLALYAEFYGTHPAPDVVPQFRYGLADVVGRALAGARAIAAPGCFATAAQLALWPLARVAPDAEPSLFAVTGSSGAGVKPRDTTHHPMRAHNLFAYSVLHHRHDAEVLAGWREWTGRADARTRLMTHSGPFVRGIHLTLHAWLDRVPGRAPGDVAAAYRAAYAGRPFVRVLDEPPQLTHAVGTNYALLQAVESADGRELQVMIVIDNLVKGAGGQALQAMNLALGLPETAGLADGGIFPC